MNATARASGWAWALLTAAAAHAGCSRPIKVPMAPVGLSATFDGERASGLYPMLMRELGKAIDCQFQFDRVPRARLQKMFESGQADVMLPAAQAPSRDVHGEFVPIMQVRVSLVTLTRELPPPRSLAELLNKRSYKVAVVRGFSFGPAYDQALATLQAQHRLVEQPDAAGVARVLRQGLAQVTIMTPHIFVGTLKQEPDLKHLAAQVLVEPLAELGWAESGLYLSLQLSDADRHTLRTAVKQAVRSGRVWQMLTETYPPGSLHSSVRPLPP